MIKSPVLLIVYNRPDFVEHQLKLLLKQPNVSTIYIAGDGPKKTSKDRARVTEVKTVVKRLSTKTSDKVSQRIKTHFSPKNQGCQRGVESAINWFFEHETQGIILEDDCRPDPTFFVYCGELLEKYQADVRIGMISGTKPVQSVTIKDSYFFSRHSMVWGWATWKRAWQDYQAVKQQGLVWLQGEAIRSALLELISLSQLKTIEKVLRGEIDTWDYIWYLTNLVQSRYCILPSHNLISNVGFLPDATHTKLKTTQSELPVLPLRMPLKHPTVMLANHEFDQKYLAQQKKWRVLLSVVQVYGREWMKKLHT